MLSRNYSFYKGQKNTCCILFIMIINTSSTYCSGFMLIAFSEVCFREIINFIKVKDQISVENYLLQLLTLLVPTIQVSRSYDFGKFVF